MQQICVSTSHDQVSETLQHFHSVSQQLKPPEDEAVFYPQTANSGEGEYGAEGPEDYDAAGIYDDNEEGADIDENKLPQRHLKKDSSHAVDDPCQLM